MDFFRKLGKQISQIWLGMTRSQQVVLGVLGVAITAIMSMVVYMGLQTDYQLLSTGLSPEDAGAITSKLSAKGINYRLTAGGTSILVPSEQMSQIRVELANEGLSTKIDGNGLFDVASLNMSPSRDRITYLRALQGELARTIMGIDPVIFARVHIVLPDSSPFINERKPATASITLKIRPGATLTANVSAGIVAVAARSVEGLTKENITLLDTNGRTLWDQKVGESGEVGSQIEYQREIEKYLADKAESMLNQFLGPGRAVVRVAAVLDLKKEKTTSTLFKSEDKTTTKETSKTRKDQNGSGSKGGATGTTQNLGKGSTTGSSGGSNSSEEETTTEYDIPKITTIIEQKMGAIKNLSISAMVDLTNRGAEGTESEKLMKIDDALELIKNAVGFRSDRKDEIKVQEIKLPDINSNVEFNKLWETHTQWQNTLSMIRNGSLGMMALVGLILGWMILRSLSKALSKPEEEEANSEEIISLTRIATNMERNPEALAKVLDRWLKQEAEVQQPPPRVAA